MAIPVKYIGNKYANTPKPESSGNPREIATGNLKAYQPFNTSTILKINNFMWINSPVVAGRLFLTTQGKRLILEANRNRVIYVLLKAGKDNNKIFIQPSKGFIADVIYFPYEETGRRLQPIKKLAEYEIQFLIGVFSTTSWGAFGLVLGMDVLEFTVNNKDNFPRWNRIIQACITTRKDIVKYAPTLYDKLVYSTLLFAWEGTSFAGEKKGSIASTVAVAALEDPKVAGRGAGIIIGKLGAGVADGKISVLSAIWTVLFAASTKLLVALPSAIKQTAENVKEATLSEKKDIAEKILSIVRKSDINITKDEALVIADEVITHRKELVTSFKTLSEAFKENS